MILYQSSLAAVLQTDEDIFVVFHDISKQLHAVVNPSLLSDFASLHFVIHFVVLFVIGHTMIVMEFVYRAACLRPARERDLSA